VFTKGPKPLPTVRVPVPKVTELVVLALVRELIVLLKLFRSRTPLPVIVTGLVVPNAVVDPACRVPELMVVAPVYVLSPDRLRIPPPLTLIGAPVPRRFTETETKFEDASENPPLARVNVEPPVSFKVMAPAPLATWTAWTEKLVSTVDVNALGVVLLKMTVTPVAGSPNDQLTRLFQF
jgi:hypothetical protein